MEHVTEDCQCEGKICTKCTSLLCVHRYGPRRGSSDGRKHWCYDCSNAYQREYGEKNREYFKNYRKKYLKRYHSNSEQRKEYKRLWCEAHSEHRKIQKKEWDMNNPERTHALGQKGNAVRRQRLIEVGGSYTYAEWRLLVQKYNCTCLCCGKKEPEITLTPDHVIPLARNGANTIDNIQPLCLTCNKKKYTKIIDFRSKNT